MPRSSHLAPPALVLALAALVAVLVARAPLAHAGELRGVVVDPAGAPVAGAQVVIDGVELVTAEDGSFVLPDGPDRADDVLVVADGYELLLTRLRAGRPARLVLTPGAGARGVEVVALEAAAPFVDQPVTYDLGAEAIRAVPGAGNDALKALQSLPGVARIPFGLGGLVLRGKSPRSTNVFLDGIEVPLLYHFGGLASFFPTAMIDGLELSPGGFSVRWGRAAGGVVEIRSRPARIDRWRVGSEVSLVDAQVRGEGPVAGGGLSVGLRRSYVDAVLAAAAPELTLAPRYLDGQLRWDRGSETSPGGRWTALVFGSDDLLTFTQDADAMSGDDGLDLDYRSRFARAALTWERQRGPWRYRATPSLGADEVALTADGQGITRTTIPLALRADAQRTVRDGWLAAGVDLVSARNGYDIYNEPPAMPGAGEPDELVRRRGARWATDAGAWTEAFYRVDGGALGLRPGLRLDYLGLSEQWVVDPRLTVSHELPRDVTLVTSVGRYHEPPVAADLDPAFGNQDLKASSSWQTSVGVTAPLPASSSVGVTAFWDRSRDLPVDAVTGATAQAAGGPQGGGAAAASRELTEEQFGSYSYRENTGLGRTRGVEVLVRKRSGRWSGWLAYTLSRAERRADPRLDPTWRPYVLDQPHVLTALATVPLGHWQLGARVRYASGNPITPVAATYFDTDRQDYRPVDGPILSERLPAFFQLDLRVDRVWRRPWGQLKLFLDVQNATNRLNPEGVRYNFDYSRRDYTRGLPFFPSLGLEYVP